MGDHTYDLGRQTLFKKRCLTTSGDIMWIICYVVFRVDKNNEKQAGIFLGKNRHAYHLLCGQVIYFNQGLFLWFEHQSNIV
jgi:hypothetical protein